MEKRRVVVTGMGGVSPVGCDLDTIWSNLTNGVSGIGPITHFDASKFKAKIGGELSGFDPSRFVSAKELRKMDPFSVYGIAASKLAVEDSGVDFSTMNPKRIGVIVGSGIGGLQVLQKQWTTYMEKGPDRFSPFMIPQMITNIVAGQIAIVYGLNGPNFCVTSACASAAHSIGEAMRLIKYGGADMMLAGGTEAPICELGVGGFCAMRALSFKRNDTPQQASRPFDADRDGFVCGEGAAILVLEEAESAKARGARIYCEVSGYGLTCDANHITAPLETGGGAADGISMAMNDAGLNSSDIDYINAHGTSTPLNDKAETLAIKTALGDVDSKRVTISSTKSMTGHLLGAAAGIESIVGALAIRDGVVPPTINLDNPDPDCDLDYTPHTAREMPVRSVLNNSLGFGGHNATLALTKFD